MRFIWATFKNTYFLASAAAALGLAMGPSSGSSQDHRNAGVTAQWLIFGAIKTQGMSPMFRSGYVEMLHERRDLTASGKQGATRDEFRKEVERRLEHAKEKGASAEDLAKLRQQLEREAEQWAEDIVRQETRKITYERCLFIGNGPPSRNPDSRTRIDRIAVQSLDVSLSDIPEKGLGVVVTERMGTPQSVCAGYGYGPLANEAYLQQNEYFPRPQDFGRVYGGWAVLLTVELMDDPKALSFSFSGTKAKEWIAGGAAGGAERGLRIVGQEKGELSPVYVVEVSAFGKLSCKVWIDPGRGFAVPRIELYEPRGMTSLSPNAQLSEVMECSHFVHLEKPDVYFPLLTKYTKYGLDGKPETVDTYKVFGTQQVLFGQDIGDDAFRIAFKRGMRLEDTRPNRLPGNQYYSNGLQADLRALPSELAALVDKQDPRIVGGQAARTSSVVWLVAILVACGVVLAIAIALTRKPRPRASS